VIREYLAAATREIALGGGGLSLEDVLYNVGVFRHDFEVVEETSMVLDMLLRLLESTPTSGKQVHDANIVATMQAHGITHLLTHNVGDFARFSRLVTVLPLLRLQPPG
jgi:predicted nucleic acid-binding protein